MAEIRSREPVPSIRDFEAECISINAEILFMEQAELVSILTLHENELIEEIFKDRRSILKKALDEVSKMA